MDSINSKAKLESMGWYRGLFYLIQQESQSADEIIGKIPNFILLSLDREDLFEIIRKKFEDVKTNDGTFYPALIAEKILFRLAIFVEEELLDKYDIILDKHEGSTRSQFVPPLRREQRRQRRIKEFIDGNFPE